MTSFDSVTLKKWIEQNLDFLVGARIQKIQQPTRRDFVFSLRNNSEGRKLYINITPSLYHVCFMSNDNEEKRLIEIPQKPPMFCMLLRKYIENSKICKVAQPEFERILEIYIETYNELSEKIQLCLSIELMGKHSNIILYNCDTNIILGSAHNVGADKSSVREIIGGLPYVYPPKKSSSWYVCENSLSNSSDINTAVDDYYAEKIYKDKFQKLKAHYFVLTDKKLKKLKNSVEKIKNQQSTSEDINKYRLYGDLIVANLYNNKDYSSEISVFDYENNCDIKIPLDNTKTLKDNANKYYKLYNKGKTSIIKLSEMLEQLEIEKKYVEQILYSVTRAENIKELMEIKSELEPEQKIKDKKPAIIPKSIKDGDFTIYIGKNNKQNDYIVSKLAKDEDLWFHTRTCAGSHVLLKGDNPSDEMILRCATLAKENSSASNSPKVGVIFTKAKYLKKPPKANLGYVTYKNEQEIIID